MPIYEYECVACGHRLESFEKMNEAPLTSCPECHQPKLQKLVSAAGFQLKGTGWYATDFRNKSKTESVVEKKKENSTESTTEKKSDPKPPTTDTAA